jgi:hypothetical protein
MSMVVSLDCDSWVGLSYAFCSLILHGTERALLDLSTRNR